MNSYGNTHVGKHSIFMVRKTRSNKGVKRGPRKPQMIQSGNVIMANQGGIVHVHHHKVRNPRSNKGVKRGPRAMMYGNTRVGKHSIFHQRKVRSNKGMKRGPRSLPRNWSLFQ